MAAHSDNLLEHLQIDSLYWPHWFGLSRGAWESAAAATELFLERYLEIIMERLLSAGTPEHWLEVKEWPQPDKEFSQELVVLIDHYCYTWPLAARAFFLAQAMHTMREWLASCMQQCCKMREGSDIASATKEILWSHKKLGLQPKPN